LNTKINKIYEINNAINLYQNKLIYLYIYKLIYKFTFIQIKKYTKPNKYRKNISAFFKILALKMSIKPKKTKKSG